MGNADPDLQPRVDDRTALLGSLTLVTARTWFRGTTAGAAEAIDAALKRYPLGAIPLQDRPYFEAATAYARIGRPDRARALLDAYRGAVADTAPPRPGRRSAQCVRRAGAARRDAYCQNQETLKLSEDG